MASRRLPSLIGAIVLIVLAMRMPAAVPASEKMFLLPSGDASATLQQFAAQSGEQIVYMVDNVRGEKTRPIQGRFTPRAALDRMLEGTLLVASHDPATGA